MDIETIRRRMAIPSKLLSRLGALALLLMVIVTACDVVCRYLFNAPILGAFELTEFLVLVLIFSFLGYTQSEKAHISVDIFFNRLPPRAQAVVELITHLLALLLMGLIAWMGIVRGLEFKAVAQKSPNLGILIYPFAFFLALGSAIMCLELVRDLLRLAMRTKEEDK